MIIDGECRYCHCTDSRPCVIRDGFGQVYGCWWIDTEHTICSMPMCQQAALADGIAPSLYVTLEEPTL